MKKTQQQFSHFIQRVEERYNLDLTLEDLYDIAKKIKSGKALIAGSNARTFKYKVRHKGKQMLIVVDRQHSAFLTALPLTKYNQRVSFHGQKYTYMDALYINYQYQLCFGLLPPQTQISCPKCGGRDIYTELGKDRFRCSSCHHIMPYKPTPKPVMFIELSCGQHALNLTQELWWYLYTRQKVHNDLLVLFENKYLLATTSEEPDEDQIFIIDGTIKLPFGTYTIEIIKEKLWQQSLQRTTTQD